MSEYPVIFVSTIRPIAFPSRSSFPFSLLLMQRQRVSVFTSLSLPFIHPIYWKLFSSNLSTRYRYLIGRETRRKAIDSPRSIIRLVVEERLLLQIGREVKNLKKKKKKELFSIVPLSNSRNADSRIAFVFSVYQKSFRPIDRYTALVNTNDRS